jgi:hypothetical protein
MDFSFSTGTSIWVWWAKGKRSGTSYFSLFQKSFPSLDYFFTVRMGSGMTAVIDSAVLPLDTGLLPSFQVFSIPT